MSDAAKKARREYMRKYREKNKERIRETHREWRSKPENRKKLKANQARYWDRKAAEMNGEEVAE